MKSSIVIGVDTGGTFTDFVCIEYGRTRIHKVPSTPADPAEAVLRGVRELLEGSRAKQPAAVLYGTTVATNALIQRKGARTALITTAGFEDVIEIGRQVRDEIYDMNVTSPPPIVERALRFGVRERVSADGGVLIPLARTPLAGIAARLKRDGVRSVAVCFINSYANPSNELVAKRLLGRHFKDVHASFDVLPEYREYERFSTTCANAYVAPLLREHVGRLRSALGRSRLHVMQSNGGLASAAHASGNAVHSILSGPAAGVLGAFVVAKEAGLSRFISFDMGGTSTDVSLCDGRIDFRSDAVVGGCPIKTPIVNVHTVGAGGGSIAWIDRGGALRVGPGSAGAEPGPACYGRGTEFTVTDANLLLGRIQSDHFLGGRMRLYPDRARQVASVLARRLKPGPGAGTRAAMERTSEAVLDVANATMIRAVRVVSVERGHDPADFALVAFGGAAPLHAVELARALGIKRVLVPVDPGVLCARGLLSAPVMRDFSRTVLSRSAELSTVFANMDKLARAYLEAEGVRAMDAQIQRYVDVRYAGQSYEIVVPFARDFRRVFDAAHGRLYGHCSPERKIEVVNARVRAIGRMTLPGLEETRRTRPGDASVLLRSGRGPGAPAGAHGPAGFGGMARVRAGARGPAGFEPARRAETFVSGRFRPIPVYERSRLPQGAKFPGPALVVEESSTTLVPGDAKCRVDGRGNLILET